MYSARYSRTMMRMVVCLLALIVLIARAEADIKPPSPVVPVPAGQQDKASTERNVPPAARAKSEPAANKNTAVPPRTEGTSAKSATAGKEGSLEPVNLHQPSVNPKWDQPYLLVAYGAVWLIMLVYLLVLARRLSEAEQQLRMMEEQIADLVPPEEK